MSQIAPPNQIQLEFHSIQAANKQFEHIRSTLPARLQVDGDCAFANFFLCYADVYETMDDGKLLAKALHNLDEAVSVLRLFLSGLPTNLA